MESSRTSDKSRACKGERTLTDGDFEECLECGTRVRWDLVDHPFWGFHNCGEKPLPAETIERAVERTGYARGRFTVPPAPVGR
jgi:hypothetical protein